MWNHIISTKQILLQGCQDDRNPCRLEFYVSELFLLIGPGFIPPNHFIIDASALVHLCVVMGELLIRL